MNRSCPHHVIVLIALLRFSMNLYTRYMLDSGMCGVIVVDADRSRSANLGRDAYIMIIAWISS